MLEEQDPAQGHGRARQELSTLDSDFIRVLEDVIDALLANGTLRLTDLPPNALEKLSQRKLARERLRSSLDLLDDDDAMI